MGEGDEEMGCGAHAVDCEGGEAAAADSRAAGSGGEHHETTIMILLRSILKAGNKLCTLNALHTTESAGDTAGL